MYLNDFIIYYFNKQQKTVNPIKTYQEEIAGVFKNSKKNKNISFDDLLDNSYLYQRLILQNSDQKYNFINNQMPFFSTKNNFNFTKPTLTDCFIMIIDNPYNVYQTIKNQNDNDEKSRNIFKLDKRSTYFNLEKVTVEINRQGWQTNSKSWKVNVLNSLLRKIILKSELIENTYETLSSIIFHFIQSGIEINYEIIQEFIKNNPVSFKKLNKTSHLKKKILRSLHR